MKKQVELVQGTLDMLILKAVSLAVSTATASCSACNNSPAARLQIQQGSLYPALCRLERQGGSSHSRVGRKRQQAKSQVLHVDCRRPKATQGGGRESWNRFSLVVASVLGAVPESS